MVGISLAYSAGRQLGLLDRERTVAGAGFNRWLVPPAALAIHLCIGMAYGLSVFWLPLSHLLGGAQPLACPGMGVAKALFTTTCDWRITDLTWIFELGIVVLGGSAAIWGGWLERVGPRRAGVVAALCWSSGWAVSAAGVATHQLWLMWLGTGVIGGVGLGLGYISPVSTLIKWFPDRRGMATGMAIMGFGGGAMIGAPLANLLMNQFHSADTAGIWQSFLVLGAGHLVFMLGGAFGYRVPPAGWRPEGLQAAAALGRGGMVSSSHVHLRNAHRTPQFWLVWLVLFLNVSAGIGVLAVASPMLQEIFGGRLIGDPSKGFLQLDAGQLKQVAGIAAGFLGLLSLFNIAGRFFWASISDRIGRRATYATFFALGVALYAASPWAAHGGSLALFVAFVCVILSMYGGGFATVPAYLADLFGTQFVGAIHGRLLTAWSAAGVVGPSLVANLRANRIAAGVPRDQVYDQVLYILAGLLVVGFVANLLVRPVSPRWQMSAAEMVAIDSRPMIGGSYGIGTGGVTPAAVLAWAAVGIPLGWGVYRTLTTALKLFG
jgi:MFS family permease